MKAIDSKTRWAAAGAIVAASILTGCGSGYHDYDQELLDGGMCNPDAAPAWVKSGVAVVDEENLYFIGRGIGYNILDERAAYDSARDHATEQLAKYILTRVQARMARGDERQFAMETGWAFVGLVQGHQNRGRFLPGERADQMLETSVRAATKAVVGDLEDRAVYWEQWAVGEVPQRPFEKPLKMRRYKCWLLMSVPRGKLNERIRVAVEAVLAAAAGCPQSCLPPPQPAQGDEKTTKNKAEPPPRELDALGAYRLYEIDK